ncbi:MAG: DJ-1/PfpI family protein [Myxococcota bacterium]
MEIAVLLFERVTALDAIGPYEVLSRLPGAKVRFVGARPGPVRTDNGFLGLQVDAALSEVSSADILVVPGGHGTRALMDDEDALAWVRRIHETTRFTTSVCTGSLVLAAAGLLKGLKATTHWNYRALLAEYGAVPTVARSVTEGKIVTAAGVSAGIDMALSLAATIASPPVAQAIQLGIEYDPAPPFSGGSLETSDPAIVAIVRSALESG